MQSEDRWASLHPCMESAAGWLECQCQCQSKFFSLAKITKLLRRPRGRSVIKAQCQEMTGEKEVFLDVDGRQTEKKMLGEVGCQTSNAATGNVCRPTVVSQNDGTSSWCDDADRSRRRLGRSATRTSWFRYDGARPCSTQNVMTATLKSTRCGRRSQCRVAWS